MKLGQMVKVSRIKCKDNIECDGFFGACFDDGDMVEIQNIGLLGLCEKKSSYNRLIGVYGKSNIKIYSTKGHKSFQSVCERAIDDDIYKLDKGLFVI